MDNSKTWSIPKSEFSPSIDQNITVNKVDYEQFIIFLRDSKVSLLVEDPFCAHSHSSLALIISPRKKKDCW